jgi:hypothetical protein
VLCSPILASTHVEFGEPALNQFDGRVVCLDATAKGRHRLRVHAERLSHCLHAVTLNKRDETLGIVFAEPPPLRFPTSAFRHALDDEGDEGRPPLTTG